MKTRHRIIHLGGKVGDGFLSITAETSEFTSGILYLQGIGATVEVMAGPTSVSLAKPAGTRAKYTLSAARGAYYIEVMPGRLRFYHTDADLVDAWVEGIREIA